MPGVNRPHAQRLEAFDAGMRLVGLVDDEVQRGIGVAVKQVSAEQVSLSGQDTDLEPLE
ncbi:MAG: hypothetical protein IT297_05880 [Anaerolineae bacterium]|nr:hypothetical protein [Anaerolineae bacterium]MCZ7552570.1 hypothetical protein [Anaerolineales bacterium]